MWQNNQQTKPQTTTTTKTGIIGRKAQGDSNQGSVERKYSIFFAQTSSKTSEATTCSDSVPTNSGLEKAGSRQHQYQQC